MTNIVHRMPITDSLYLFAAFKRNVIESIKLESNNFEFCVEISIKAFRAGFKFTEVPSTELKREAGNSKVNAFYHGLRIMWEILTCR